jgi:hypothetical protein
MKLGGFPRTIAISLMLGAISGCAVQGESFGRVEPPLGKAVIYAYRPFTYSGVSADPFVKCGHNGLQLGPGGYHAYVEEAGTVICHAQGETSKTAEVKIDAKPGESYYVKVQMAAAFPYPDAALNAVDAATAGPEIDQCKRQ